LCRILSYTSCTCPPPTSHPARSQANFNRAPSPNLHYRTTTEIHPSEIHPSDIHPSEILQAAGSDIQSLRCDAQGPLAPQGITPSLDRWCPRPTTAIIIHDHYAWREWPHHTNTKQLLQPTIIIHDPYAWRVWPHHTTTKQLLQNTPHNLSQCIHYPNQIYDQAR
jgi:hypothetical protein